MSKEYSNLLDYLLDGNSLAESQAYDLMNKLAEGELPEALAGALPIGFGFILLVFALQLLVVVPENHLAARFAKVV